MSSTDSSPASSRQPPSGQGGFWQDLKILWHLVASRGRGANHEERLENFYSGQASGYDSFRKRMLHGRTELFQALPAVAGGVWVDLGCGTGENAEHWGSRLSQFEHVYLVDLSSSLLKVAEQRIAHRGWKNVTAVHADATRFMPEVRADVLTFSYSLTMIPDWFSAVEQAQQILKPGGTLGIVDFFVARKYPAASLVKHGWMTRSLWPLWFGNDNVWPSPDHLPFLQSHFTTRELHQLRGKIPYLPFVRAPYYWFIGENTAPATSSPT